MRINNSAQTATSLRADNLSHENLWATLLKISILKTEWIMYKIFSNIVAHLLIFYELDFQDANEWVVVLKFKCKDMNNIGHIKSIKSQTKQLNINNISLIDNHAHAHPFYRQ